MEVTEGVMDTDCTEEAMAMAFTEEDSDMATATDFTVDST